MGHSIGDGIIVAALAAALIGYLYFKHRERLRRLEVLHNERLAAMDKGIPLPELPIDLPAAAKPPSPDVLPILGIILLTLGGSAMIVLALSNQPQYWPMPMPFMLMGLGLLLFHLLAGRNR
jgi:hypothetical protein